MTKPDWHWDEIQQIGTDYTDLAEVEAYDARMAGFRDIERENRKMLDALALRPGAALLEIGCGTGRFSRAAAARGLKVTAVDVSQVMLEFLKIKSREEGLEDIILQHAGFLTMDFPEESFDAAVSGAALHHLPDLWKHQALKNVNRVLKPNGRFILKDVVFSFDYDNPLEKCLEKFAGNFPHMRKEVARHAAQEFSTLDWIMEGLLLRTGFEILSQETPNYAFIEYHCRKKSSSRPFSA